MEASSYLPLGLGLIIFSFSISSILVIPFIDLLYKLKFTRKKEAPKTGKVPLFDKLHDIKAGTPVGGGILIIVLVSLLFALVFPLSSSMGVFIKTGVLGLTFGMSRKLKFFIQWGLAFLIAYGIYKFLGIQILHIPILNKTFSLGIWYIPFAAFVIVSFSNAFNITDGLDGLASGLLVICLLAFLIIAQGSLDTPLSMFISLWIGAMMAFLYFNVWPARLFLGDAGALSFGAMLAVIGLLTGGLVALVVIGGVFVIEAVSSLVQIIGWKVLKRPIFPLAPIHHTFLAIGWEEPKIVIRAWLAGIMLAIFGLWLATT